MNADRTQIVGEGTGKPRKTARNASRLIHEANQSVRRVLSAFLALGLIAVLSLIRAGRVTAQTFTTLHTFTPLMIHDNGNFTFSFSNGDGATPYAGLITNSSGTTLYGTASGGGSSNYGTVFAVKADGTGFTNLHSFTGGSDGSSPHGGLIRTNNTLYGTAAGAGAGGHRFQRRDM